MPKAKSHNAIASAVARPRLRPGELPAPIRQRVGTVLAVVGRARRRLWLQRSAERLATGLGAWLVAVAATSVLVRAGWLPARLDAGVAAAAAGILLVLVAVAASHRRGWIEVASLLDRRAGSHDQLGTALWLAAQERADGWAESQAAAAETIAEALDLPALTPWSAPSGTRLLAGGAALTIVALLVPGSWLSRQWQPDPASGLSAVALGSPPAVQSAADLLGADAIELIETDIRTLIDVEEQVGYEAIRVWLTDVRQVLEGVTDGSLDKRSALERLAELEASRPKPVDLADLFGPEPGPQPDVAASGEPGADPAEAERQKDLATRNAVLEAAKAAADSIPDADARKAVEEAAKAGDLDKLADLAEKLAQRQWSDKQLEKLVKAVEKFADALKDRKIPEQYQKLADRIRRLQDKRAQQGGLGPQEASRLQQARRELSQLKRDQGDPEAAKYQVQRLERGARQAADELRRQQQSAQQQRQAGGKPGQQGQPQGQRQGGKQLDQQVKQQLRAAAEELRRQSQSQQGRQAARIGEARMRDLREALERAGQRDQARDDFERRARSGQDDQGTPKPGEQGRQRLGQKGAKGEGQRGKAGQKREGSGQPGEGSSDSGPKRIRLGQGGLGDKSRVEILREEQSQQSGQGGGAPGQPGPGQGEGAGEDPNAERGPRLAGGKRERLRGVQGEGPDIKKVFTDTARKGFARSGWREIYADYSEVAEEMLDKEHLPPSRRATVRRYYELIRPRAAGEAP